MYQANMSQNTVRKSAVAASIPLRKDVDEFCTDKRSTRAQRSILCEINQNIK